jgi:hypothetical protein
MVAEIIQVFVDVFTNMVSALTTLITTAFSDLVYNSTDGLSDIATWALVFGGIALVLGLVQRFIKS